MSYFNVEQELEKILRIMQQEKEGDSSRCERKWMNGIIVMAAILVLLMIMILIFRILWMLQGETRTFSDVIATFTLIVSLMVSLPSIGQFFVETLQRKEYFIFYKIKNYKRIEKILLELPRRAQEKKIKIRDIEVFEIKNRIYLKIYYSG